MNEKNNEEIKKLPKDKCIENFKKYILGNELNSSQTSYIYNNKQDLLSYGIKGEFSSIYLRPMAYKIFLNLLPIDKSLKQWISITFNNRFTYFQLKSMYFQTRTNNKSITKNSINSLTKNNNILNTEDDKEKEKDEELKKLINLDLLRTFQEISLFKEEKNIKILFNILYIYSKEHSHTNPYKQGMNEIIAILFLAIYPYYFPSKKVISRIEIINAINSYNKKTKTFLCKNIQKELINKNNINKKGIDILFNFFHDEKNLEVDLYYLFNDLMEKGFKIFYKDDLFQKRCDHIINNKLKIIDFELFQHFNKINVPYNIFFGKWIQSFFDQVTKVDNCISILDIIISKDFLDNHVNSDIYYIKKNDLYEMEFIDCLCLSMIKKYREDLLQKNDEEILIFYLCYPEIQDIKEIIQSANYINLTIKNRKIDIYKISDTLEKKSTLKFTPKKKIYYSKKLRSKLNSKNHLGFSESTSNFYKIKTKKLIKNNTIIGNIDINNNDDSTQTNIANTEKSNKSTKLLDTKKSNLNENSSKLSFFERISSFSHQFDEYKGNDLIDTYYF